MDKNKSLNLICRIFGIKTVYAWSKATHEDIVKKSLALLEKEKKTRPVGFYKNYTEQILKGCTQPDEEGDIDHGSGMHYYSSVNQKGKELSTVSGYYKNRNGELVRSARTLFEDNYTSAVSLYKSGKTEQAMISLGRALHFVSDIGCTVHVANIRRIDKPNNVHYAFEKHVTTSCAKHTAESYDKRLSKYYEKDNVGEALNKLSKYAAKFTDTILHLDPRAFDDVAKNTLPVTQQNCMAVLLKFYDDCNSDKGNYICDKKLYSVKNEISGLMLTASKKGLTLENSDKTLEQKLQIVMADDGTVGLKISDGGYVNDSCKGYDYLKIDGEPARFRFTALGNRRFRISAKSGGFEKFLTNTKGGKLTFSGFDPESSAQIWILN
jgi:hypothetical protein